MGTDKAKLVFRGLAEEPAAVSLARGLSTLFEHVLLIGGSPPAEAPGRRVSDPEGPRCALRGLVGALEASPSDRVLVVATDLPGLTPALLLGMLAAPEADVVLPRSDGRLQPLCALYRREVSLERARQQLARGALTLAGVLEGLSLEVLEGDDLAALDPDGLALFNVNSPEDRAEFESRVATRGATSW
jgi:molybdopterin-guanine dinucleotide biosynthesis protein A